MMVRWEGKDLILQIYTQPNAKCDAVVGTHGDYLKIKITAPAVENQANQHLAKWLAKEFEVPKKNITLMQGKQSRQKVFRIEAPQQIPEFIQT